MKKLTREEIEKQDSYAVASIIDYWKEYEKDTVILAYITLIERNEVGIVEGRKFKFDKFSKHYGIKSLDILGDYVNQNPQWEDSRVMVHADDIFNKKVYQFEFKKLGIITKILGYLIGFVFVLTLLTIAGPLGVIVGLIIYFLGWKFSKIGFLVYDSYKELISEQISHAQFQDRWRRSMAVTLALTLFFSLVLFVTVNIDKAFTDGLPAVIALVVMLVALIPQYILLSKLHKKHFKSPNINNIPSS